MALWQDCMLAAWPRSLLQDRMLAAWPWSLLQDHLLATWPQSLLPHSSPTPEKLLSVPPVNKYPKCLVEPVLVLQQGKYFYDMFLAFTFKVKTSRAPLTLCCVVIVFVNHVVNHFINLLLGPSDLKSPRPSGSYHWSCHLGHHLVQRKMN